MSKIENVDGEIQRKPLNSVGNRNVFARIEGISKGNGVEQFLRKNNNKWVRKKFETTTIEAKSQKETKYFRDLKLP